jgi:hypothetical protein
MMSITSAGVPDEYEAGVRDCARERRPFGQEAVAGVDCVGGGPLSRRDEGRDGQVRLGRGGRPDMDGHVGLPHVRRVAVGVAVDGDAA